MKIWKPSDFDWYDNEHTNNIRKLRLNIGACENPIDITLTQKFGIKRAIDGSKYAPTWPILNAWHQNHNKEEYISAFINLMRQRYLEDPKHFLRELKGYTLICYEESGQFCHRHILSKLIELF